MRAVAWAVAGASVVFAALAGTSHAQQTQRPGIDGVTYAGETVVPHRFNGDVRTLPPALPIQERPARSYRPLRAPPPVAKVPLPGAPPEAPSAITTPLAPMPSPTHNFAGLN